MISLKDGTLSCSLLKQDMEVVIPSADTPGGIGNYCGSEDVPEMAGLGISLLMFGAGGDALMEFEDAGTPRAWLTSHTRLSHQSHHTSPAAAAARGCIPTHGPWTSRPERGGRSAMRIRQARRGKTRSGCTECH